MVRKFFENPALKPFAYELYPLGTIKPLGWLKHEITLSAKGLGGHLFDFYRFVKDSTWLGGTVEYSTLNEAAPYWYNYIVPLAFSIDEQLEPALAKTLKQQARTFLDYTLKHQAEDGWIGPEKTPETRGIWARCLVFQGLINHAIAEPSRAKEIIEAMTRFSRLAHSMLRDNYTGFLPKDGDVFDGGWFGVARAHELSLNLQWLYDQVDDGMDKRVIWEVMDLLWKGAEYAGRDWTKFFTDDQFPTQPSDEERSLNFEHGVNLAQGLRYAAQKYRMHPSDDLRYQCRKSVDLVLRYHGMPAGAYSCDEYLGGTSPQRSVELCTSAEFIFSLNYLYRLLGDPEFAEQAERAAFNAYPAAIAPDWWSHQYVTQTNQPWAKELSPEPGEKIPYFNCGRYANVFGLEPDYPCCLVNHPVVYPKIAMNSFLQINPTSPSSSPLGILHAMLLPAELSIPGYTIKCETRYPFADTFKYTITCATAFDLSIRFPQWNIAASTIRTSDTKGTSHTLTPLQNHKQEATFPFDPIRRTYRFHIPKSPKYILDLTIVPEIQVHTFPDGSISIYRGPLLYAYEIPHINKTTPPQNYKDQKDQSLSPSPSPSPISLEPWTKNIRDHILLPASHWGLAINPFAPMTFFPNANSDPAATSSDDSTSSWTSPSAGLSIEVEACEIDWPVANGTAADPATFDAKNRVIGGRFKVRLVPYGCAKLHLARFPTV